MNALAGLINPAAVGQSFQMGMEQGRARRGEMETQNALSMLAKDPNSAEGMDKLSFYQPQAAMQMQQQRQAAAMAARKQQLTGLAGQGDKRALAELWGVDAETAMKLDDRQLDEAAKGFDFIANAAFAIDALPPEQQAAAFDAYIEQGVQLGFDGLSQYRGQYNPQMMQGLVAKAGEMKPFMERRDPRYMAIPEGGTLVDTRNPEAVQDFGSQAPAPVAEKVIGGTSYVQDANGDWYVKGGAGGNVSGGFPGS